MTITVHETYASGEIGELNSRFEVLCTGTDSPFDAFREIQNGIPSSVDVGGRTLFLLPIAGMKRNGHQSWKAPIEYGTEEQAAAAAQQNPNGEAEIGSDFEIGGGTVHITQSIQTISRNAPPGKTAPDFKGAINVTKDSVEGADIPARSFSFSETRSYLDRTVTQAFKKSIYNLCVCTNSLPFMNFDAGEVLFLGASGSNRGKGLWTVNFKFVAIPNSTFNVGSIVGISKKGHELLWIRYEDVEDSTAKSLVKRPTAAYIEKVLESGDLNNLPL